MKNKIELKKFIIKISWVSLLILLMFILINNYQYQKYTENFNNKVSNIVEIIESKYPLLDEKEIIDILNSKSNTKNNILDKYTLSLNNKSIIMENDKLYNKYLIFNTLIFVISLLFLIYLFIKYLQKREKAINDITKYIKELNKKNYSLKIDSNTEDDLSILKNEIYKTTVMLKETRDISIKDKKNLKKSLEDISHQIKTPLTSILVMLDNLIDDPDMDKHVREDFIRDIKRNVNNISFLVQSILKLSKFDVNAIKFMRKKFYLKDCIQEASKNVSTLCDLKNIKLNIKGDDTAFILGDFMWQVEAITNILKNSLEYSSLNSTIDIIYEQNNAYAKISIIDYGECISKQDLPHIFERFYKGKNSSSDSIGIGLALSKAIIENDNGVVNVESNKNSTKFIIKYFNI